MIAYKDAFDLIEAPELQKRVRYARLHAAAYVAIEDPAVPGHAARAAWAAKALKEELQMPLRQVMLYVVVDPAVQQDGAAVTDAALQAAVDALIPNMVAGG